MKAEIHDRGRGPEIKGSRITVYDVLDYRGKYPTERIADLFKLTVEQIEAAYAYIDAHKDEVMAEYAKMLAREKKGNPPHIRAMLAEGRRKLLALKKEFARKRREKIHA